MVAGAMVADALRARRADLAASITRALYERHPEWDARWGVAGRELTLRDASFHLEFLEAAIRADRPEVFARYSSWLGQVLRSRGVPTEAAAENYDLMLEAMGPLFAAKEQEGLAAILTLGRAALRDPAPVPGRLEATLDPRAVALLDALLKPDRAAAQIILEAALRELGVARVADVLVQPAMAELGARWQENRISVAQEHLASAVLQTALARAFAATSATGAASRRALLACAEGNHHAIGLRLVADAFDAEGWDVRYLGPDVPTRELVAAASAWRPHLLGVSISLPQHIATARRAIEAVRLAMGADAPRIIAGGIPLRDHPGLGEVVGADAWFPSVLASVEASRA